MRISFLSQFEVEKSDDVAFALFRYSARKKTVRDNSIEAILKKYFYQILDAAKKTYQFWQLQPLQANSPFSTHYTISICFSLFKNPGLIIFILHQSKDSFLFQFSTSFQSAVFINGSKLFIRRLALTTFASVTEILVSMGQKLETLRDKRPAFLENTVLQGQIKARISGFLIAYIESNS